MENRNRKQKKGRQQRGINERRKQLKLENEEQKEERRWKGKNLK